jgi:MerR family copper efflux transcriptional regulator
MHGLSIGQLAKTANVSIDTIRFYEKTGLSRPCVRRPSGFREYSELDLRQLRFIRRGRLLGFSLDEIRELLALEGEQASVVSVIHRKLLTIDRKIEELQHWRSSLHGFLEQHAASASTRHSILDCFTDEAADSLAEAIEPLRSMPVERL